jgi:hypothetical protein
LIWIKAEIGKNDFASSKSKNSWRIFNFWKSKKS